MLFQDLVDPEFLSWVRALPKTETHLHLEGAVPYEILHQWNAQEFPRNPDFLEKSYRYRNFAHFEKTLLEHAVPWFTSPERYHETAKAVIAKLQDQNVQYLETSFHIGILEIIGVKGEEIIDAIKSAVPADFTLRVFMGMVRDSYEGKAKKIIDDFPNWTGLDGVDLHGSEDLPLQEWTERAWQEALQAGKEAKAHAGEFGSVDNVRAVLERLPITRLQHGNAVARDAGLIEMVRTRDITLDMCPVSNWKLRATTDWPAHPLPKLHEVGIRCTVSTDDPMVIGNTVTDEYLAMAKFLGMSRAEILQVLRNGWEVATVAEGKREKALQALSSMAEYGDERSS